MAEAQANQQQIIEAKIAQEEVAAATSVSVTVTDNFRKACNQAIKFIDGEKFDDLEGVTYCLGYVSGQLDFMRQIMIQAIPTHYKLDLFTESCNDFFFNKMDYRNVTKELTSYINHHPALWKEPTATTVFDYVIKNYQIPKNCIVKKKD